MALSRRAMLRQTLVATPLLSSELFASMLEATEPQAPEEKWYWYPGHSLAFKSIGKDTGGTCTWVLVENSPREGVPFHKHQHEDESFYVIAGRFEITVGDSTISGGPGTYMYGPRGVQHRWTNVGSERGRLLNVFTPSGLEDYFLAVAIPIGSSSEQPSVDMAALNARMTPLREKFGLIRTGTTKYPRPGDPTVSNPAGDSVSIPK
jgi:quercetin dioxygenase-like cupin family protein